MNDEVNKNPLPRIVRGTGFYTPMDIAPGESPVAATPAPEPTVVGESVGLPTPMNVTPPAPTAPSASEPAQTGEGNGNAKNN